MAKQNGEKLKMEEDKRKKTTETGLFNIVPMRPIIWLVLLIFVALAVSKADINKKIFPQNPITMSQQSK